MQTVEPYNCRQQAIWIMSRFTPGLACTHLKVGFCWYTMFYLPDGLPDANLNTFKEWKLGVTCSRGEPGEPALLYSQRLCSPLITARVPSTGGYHSHQGYIHHGYTDSIASPCCSVTDHFLQYVMIRNGLTTHTLLTRIFAISLFCIAITGRK